MPDTSKRRGPNAPPDPDQPTTSDLLAAYVQQRNDALAALAQQAAVTAARGRQVDALTAEVTKLRAQLASRAQRRTATKATARTPARKATAPRKR